MPKKRRVIASESSTKLISTTAAADKQRSNTRMSATIRAQAASSLALLFLNGGKGYPDTDLPTSLAVQSSVRLFNGATALGAGYTEPGAITVARSNRKLTASMALTPAFGNTVKMNAWADAGSGKKVPLTIYCRDTGWNWGFVKGDSLSPVLDGSVADVVEGWPGNSRAYYPTALTGLTHTKTIGFLGHSLVEGNGTVFFRGFAQLTGDVLGVPAVQAGIGASNVGAWGAFVDVANLDLCDVVVILWTINNLNSAVTALTPTATFVTNEAAAITQVIKDLKTSGKTVVLCTEGPCGPEGGLVADHYTKLAAWNSHVRANGTGSLGADRVFDVAEVLFLTTDSGVLRSTFTADAGDVIHWGPTAHQAVATALAADLVTAGYVGEDDGTYAEFLRVEFDGAATSVPGSGASTVLDGLTPVEKYQDRWMFRMEGNGSLGVVKPASDAFVHYLVPMGDAGHAAGEVEATFTYQGLPWTTVGYGVGWTEKAFVGGKVYLRGYFAHMTKSRLVIFAHSDSDGDSNVTELGAVFLDAEMGTGKRYRIKLRWVPGSGANCNLAAELYSESRTPLKTVTVTGNATAGIYNASLSPVIVYRAAASGGLEPNTQTDLCERFVAYDYVANTITSVTIDQGATLSVAGGASSTLTATVAGTGTFPATVSWKVNSGPGTVGFNSGVFTSPAATGSPQTTVVQATSAGGAQTATITITTPASGATYSSVTIDQGATLNVAGSATSTLTATVAGTGGFSSTVTWSKTSGVGSVNSSTGVYTAPAATGSPQTAVIRATAADGITTDEITITIPAIGASITGIVIDQSSPFTLSGGATQTFTATVSGTGGFDASKTWSKVSGPGTINASTGLYTAPASTGSVQTAVLRATASDGTTTAQITVNIAATVSDDTALMATRFLTMIEQIGTSGQWRFKAAALTQAPTGSSGGSGGYQTRPGLLCVVLADGVAAINEITLNQGEVTWVESRVVDEEGVAVSLDGATLGIVLTGPGGFSQELESGQIEKILDGDDVNIDGRFRWLATNVLGELTGQARRNVRLILTLDRGATSKRSALARIQVVA